MIRLAKMVTLAALTFFLSAGSATTSFQQTYPGDNEILLPPYYGVELVTGVSGKVVLTLDFDNGTVQSVNVASSNLVSSRTDFARNYPELNALFHRNLSAVVRHWTTFAMRPFSRDVVFEFVIDPTLKQGVREYSLEYDNPNFPNKVIIRGPAIKRPQ